jgi:hypothetical protein
VRAVRRNSPGQGDGFVHVGVTLRVAAACVSPMVSLVGRRSPITQSPRIETTIRPGPFSHIGSQVRLEGVTPQTLLEIDPVREDESKSGGS